MMASGTQRDNHDDIKQTATTVVATTKTCVQWCHHEGIIIMVLSQWCHHDGIITIMMWSQQQKHLYVTEKYP